MFLATLVGCQNAVSKPPVPAAKPNSNELLLGGTPGTATIDLGDVDPGFATESSVRVTNSGTKPVTIARATSSCECTSVPEIPVTLAAGASQELKVATDTNHEPDFRGSLAIEVQLEDEQRTLGTIRVLITVKAGEEKKPVEPEVPRPIPMPETAPASEPQ